MLLELSLALAGDALSFANVGPGFAGLLLREWADFLLDGELLEAEAPFEDNGCAVNVIENGYQSCMAKSRQVFEVGYGKGG